MIESKKHWENVYHNQATEKLGWYESHLQLSLKLIRQAGLAKEAAIIDVGGGASTLADDLLDEGFNRLTVLDLSSAALSKAQARLGTHAAQIVWVQGDITRLSLPRAHYDLWHDRALFHFLLIPEDRLSYAALLHYSLKPGGQIIIGAFAPEAPPRCSGLAVERYSAERLHQVLGGKLKLLSQLTTLHLTPGGVEQMYLYCHFEKPA